MIQTKLKTETARKIKAFLALGYSASEIGRAFSVSRQSVSKIANGKTHGKTVRWPPNRLGSLESEGARVRPSVQERLDPKYQEVLAKGDLHVALESRRAAPSAAAVPERPNAHPGAIDVGVVGATEPAAAGPERPGAVDVLPVEDVRRELAADPVRKAEAALERARESFRAAQSRDDLDAAGREMARAAAALRAIENGAEPADTRPTRPP